MTPTKPQNPEDFALHLACLLLVSAESEEERCQARSTIGRRLEEGFDPNALDEKQRSPMAILAGMLHNKNIIRNEDMMIFMTLIEHGGNPLRGDRVAYALNRHSLIVSKLIDRMLDLEEAGRGMRSEDGSNIYHAMAGNGRFHISNEVCNRAAERLLIQEARQLDGKTPLHLLWEQKGVVAKQERESVISLRMVNNTWCFLERGASLGDRDHAGISIGQLIGRQLNNAVNLLNQKDKERLVDLKARVVAYQQEECLLENTPAVNGRKRQGLRL